jgi:hypothetical protein
MIQLTSLIFVAQRKVQGAQGVVHVLDGNVENDILFRLLSPFDEELFVVVDQNFVSDETPVFSQSGAPHLLLLAPGLGNFHIVYNLLQLFLTEDKGPRIDLVAVIVDPSFKFHLRNIGNYFYLRFFFFLTNSALIRQNSIVNIILVIRVSIFSLFMALFFNSDGLCAL